MYYVPDHVHVRMICTVQAMLVYEPGGRHRRSVSEGENALSATGWWRLTQRVSQNAGRV